MTMKSFIKYSLIIALGSFILILNSCDKEDEIKTNNTQEKHNAVIENNQVPFFYVEKGDSISKGIYREKPNFENREVQILFTTENKMKAVGKSDYDGDNPITDLYVSIRKHNNVGDHFGGGLTRIPVDLNEGAGGKWIYLFYTRKKRYDDKSITGLIAFAQTWEGYAQGFIDSHRGENWWGVMKYNNTWADLNAGAGGPYIYLLATRSSTIEGEKQSPIKQLMIVSANTSNVNYTGWKKVDLDLNKGVGGKYIYIFYK